MNQIFKQYCIFAVFLMIVSTTLFADSSLPTDHAPIAVMGDHTHNAGEWMFSYRYGRMEMDGNRDGTSSVSTSEIHQDFMIAPLDMTMEMHMFGAMFGVNDEVTLMAMIPYKELEMEMLTRPMSMGMMPANYKFKTRSKGFGDLKLSALWSLMSNDHSSLHATIGMGFPTGSIKKQDDNAMGVRARMPYMMQLGSGTYDSILGLTYVMKSANWTYGLQTLNTFRLGKNDQGYQLGNEYTASTWASKNLNHSVSLSLRLDAKAWEDIDGDDDELNVMMAPTARTDLRGGQRVDGLLGLNYLHGSGHRLGVELGIPLHQDLDGPQMETDYRLMIGWQYAL